MLTYSYAHSIRNKIIECKIATPKESVIKQNQSLSSLEESITSLDSTVYNKQINNRKYYSPFVNNNILLEITPSKNIDLPIKVNAYFHYKLFDSQGEKISNIVINLNSLDNFNRVSSINHKKPFLIDYELSTSSDFHEIEERTN